MANSPPRRLTCYISMPFGRKPLPNGLELDFDRVYREGIGPALELAGVAPVRADALVTCGSIQKATLEAILHSDFMIADITGANPNVLYELGIRHALVPRATLVVASTDTSTPLDLYQLRVVRYETSDAGLGNAKAFVEQLREIVERRI